MNSNKWSTDFFVLRTPLYPVEKLFEVYNTLKENKDNEQVLLNTLDDTILEAIYLASPVLYDEVKKYQSNPSAFTSNEKAKLTKSVVKYVIRASSRCTPFGLFANCAVGEIGNINNLEITSGGIVKHLRLDMDALCHLAHKLKAHPKIRQHLVFFPNTAIYKANNKVKYIEYKYSSSGERTFHLSKIKSDSVLLDVLRISKKGLSYNLLCDELAARYGISKLEVQDYINTLIDNNILYSNIEPNVTGDEFFSILHSTLKDISRKEESIVTIYEKLDTINNIIGRIKLGESNVGLYRDIYQSFNKLSENLAVKEGKLFQMDTSKKTDTLLINRSEIENLISAIEEIKALDTSNQENYNLKKFKKAFSEKYENQSVKLVDVFDNETGIGYKNAKSLSDFYETRKSPSNSLESLALKKYIEFVQNPSDELLLVEKDLELFKINNKHLPDSFSIMANIVINSDQKMFFALSSITQSTTNLLGRFCHADPKLYRNILGLMEKEKEDSFILAEIAHLPQSRIGNILSRPILTDYEIEFLALSTLNFSRKIQIDDLYIRLDKGELILFSQKLKKRIIPKLSSAHNFTSGSLDIYNFLCDLQYQQSNYTQLWNWGSIYQNVDFLPRVVYKNCILSPAQWKIKYSKINKSKASSFKEELMTRKELCKIPDIVIFKQSDNYLVLDLSTIIAIEILEKEVKRAGTVWLYEFYFGNSIYQPMSMIKNELGHSYANEIIVPVRNTRKQGAIRPIEKSWLDKVANKRVFHLGENWLFIKIYGKPKNFNSILLTIYPFITQLIKSKEISEWFFIRYNDPFPHLRIRFLMSNELGTLIENINKNLKSLIKEGVVTDIVTDTYKREIERYGDKTIVQSERLFSLNSSFVCSILKGGFNYMNTQKIALWIISYTLDVFKLTFEEKCQFLNNGFKNFSREFNLANDKNLKNALQKQYRNLSEEIEQLHKKSIEEDDWCKPVKIKKYIVDLRSSISQISVGSLNRDLFIGSHIHMFVNRLFSSNQRFEEFTIYYFLDSYYRSVMARTKSQYPISQ